ncbi:MAG: peptidoglycan editing factor PgeF [Deltaproteobacteria bacterium]|nr:peptidoglycan editing factor PgeF [Deltaproteobacteria bacterium]
MLKTIQGITYYSSPRLEAVPGLVHAFLGRTGGVSPCHLSSLNLGRREEDSVEKLAENKRRVAAAFGVDEEKIFTVSQVHSDRIVVLNSVDAGVEEIKSQAADGIITDIKGIAIGILTADCVPVLLFDRKRKVVAAVHAGWKGTASKISAKAVEIMMERFESRPQDIVTAIGPAIGPCCYEVGEEVVSAVGHREGVAVQHGNKWHVDLPKANLLQLQESGVTDIDLSNICTSCRTDLFFSHRKEMGKTGRQLSFISLGV